MAERFSIEGKCFLGTYCFFVVFLWRLSQPGKSVFQLSTADVVLLYNLEVGSASSCMAGASLCLENVK